MDLGLQLLKKFEFFLLHQVSVWKPVHACGSGGIQLCNSFDSAVNKVNELKVSRDLKVKY